NILCIHQPHFISPVMQQYVRHPKICGILSQMIAAHLPWWDGSVKCMQSMLFVKPPGFQGQAWHQDEIYIPTRDRSLCGAWIALDDGTIEHGCPGRSRKERPRPLPTGAVSSRWRASIRTPGKAAIPPRGTSGCAPARPRKSERVRQPSPVNTVWLIWRSPEAAGGRSHWKNDA